MRRWSAPLGLGFLVLLCAALVVRERDAAAPKSTGDAPAQPEQPSAPSADAAVPVEEAGTPPAEPVAAAIMRRPQTFDLLEDGSPVPPLDATAPRRVKLGVALFRYRGAEGAGGQSRSREDALELASAALTKGGSDFGQVVALGDPGSAVDVGWVGRGVLERSVEYPIFTASVGETLPRPIDTPRGYWVVRRHK